MIAAHLPIQRPRQAKLLVVDHDGYISHLPRSKFPELLHRGDLVIANDAATLPANLSGKHARSGQPIEVRLAGRGSLDSKDVRHWIAVVFGKGDFRIRTEDRPMPPTLEPGDRLVLGPLQATVEGVLGHPRLVRLAFNGFPDRIWEGLARHGRPIQYAHVRTPLALWDVWTPIAGPPAALEAPSASFVLDWSILAALKKRGVEFATITHAAGISSTGDGDLDARLPFDEPYRIPPPTARAIRRTRLRGGRIIAIGTSVVRALEHAGGPGGCVRAGPGVATQRIDNNTNVRVVDAILSGTHEPGTSHYELLEAFVDQEVLRRMNLELETGNYRTHEFGDSIFVERIERAALAKMAV